MKFAISLVVGLSVLAVLAGGITPWNRFIEWTPESTEQGVPPGVSPMPLFPGPLSLPNPGTPFSLPVHHILLSGMQLTDLIPCTLAYGVPQEWENPHVEEDGRIPVRHTVVTLADGVFLIPEFTETAIGESLPAGPFFDIPEITPPGTKGLGIDWKLNF